MTENPLFRALLGLLFVFLFVAGCQEKGQPVTADHSSLSTEYIHLDREGGIAGERQTIRVAGDGEMRIRDRRRNVDVTRKLSEAEVSELFRLLAEANKNGSDKTGQPSVPGKCADCIEFRLRWETRAGGGQRRLSGPRVGGSAYATLIEKLTQRIQEAQSD